MNICCVELFMGAPSDRLSAFQMDDTTLASWSQMQAALNSAEISSLCLEVSYMVSSLSTAPKLLVLAWLLLAACCATSCLHKVCIEARQCGVQGLMARRDKLELQTARMLPSLYRRPPS